MELSRYAELFLSEAREHISTVNRLLLHLEDAPTDLPALAELFRAVHTLKGMSAAMGYTSVAELAHAMEHLLEQLQSGALQADAEIIDLLLEGADALERGVERQDAVERHDPLLGRLRSRAPEIQERAAPEQGRAPEAAGAELYSRRLRVRMTVEETALFPAARAILALRAVRRLGVVEAVDPPEQEIRAGELAGTATWELATDADDETVAEAVRSAGEVAAVAVEALGVAPATRRADHEREGAPVVRVRQDRLDALLDQVAELVVARNRLLEISAGSADAALAETVDEVASLVGSLRDEVTRLRVVRVAEVFNRFPRLVRDAARTLGKQVVFEMRGEDVELDRSLLKELSDLLVHLLRNAVDHGIEPSEERRAAGKAEQGRVCLSAARERASVVVRVEDDGRGLQSERILRGAVQRGLLTEAEAAALPEAAIFDLVTRPGLSTAEQVTDVSGRGVGLDVVGSRVHALGGSLEIASVPGAGTTFTLRLPLTLAITRALQVAVGGSVYSIPLAAVVEVAEREEDGRGATPWMRLREEEIPVIRLHGLLDPAAPLPAAGVAPVVVVDAGRRFGLQVDALLGQHDAVVKPWDTPLEVTPVFSGVTLLADGRPSLILDVERVTALGAPAPGRGHAPVPRAS